jgi:hypothetical protein
MPYLERSPIEYCVACIYKSILVHLTTNEGSVRFRRRALLRAGSKGGKAQGTGKAHGRLREGSVKAHMPSKCFSCESEMRSAAAEVKPESTESEIKRTCHEKSARRRQSDRGGGEAWGRRNGDGQR